MSEDVSGTGAVLAALQPRAELTDGEQYVDVVGADKVLGQINNRTHEGLLSVMVG